MVLSQYDASPARRKKASRQSQLILPEKIKDLASPDVFRNKIPKTAKKAIKTIRLEKCSLKTRVGLGEAARTAIVVGGATAVMKTFLPFAEAQISPEFGKYVFEFDGECILSVRVGNIIGITATGAYEVLRGRWKHGASH